MSGPPDPTTDRVGQGIIRASWIGTAIFTVAAVVTAIAPHTFIAVGVAVSLVLFFAGIVLFLWAFLIGVNRSRTDLIGIGGLFFLAGSAPKAVQRSLLGSLAVEGVVAVATAAVHPFTPLAFGVLAPMYGLALCGLWAARYGTFPPRPPEEPRRKGRSSGSASNTKASAGAKTGAAGRSGKGGRTTPPKAKTTGRTTPAKKGTAKRS